VNDFNEPSMKKDRLKSEELVHSENETSEVIGHEENR
jgi:hypothetical protein